MATREYVLNNITDQVVAPPAQFLNTLSNWSTTPAHQFMWVVSFSVPGMPGGQRLPLSLISGAISQLEAFNTTDWRMQFDSAYLGRDTNHIHGGGELNGCMLAQGVNIPGEQMSHEYVGVSDRGGILPLLIGKERLEPQEFTMMVYEGNTSFLDTVMRQWIILTSRFGMIARPYESPLNIKCTVTVTQFAKTVGREVTRDISGEYVDNIPDDDASRWQQDALGRQFGGVIARNTKLIPQEGTNPAMSGLVARKTITFYNACPVRMEASDLTYSDDGGVMTKNVTFAYTHYGVRNFNVDSQQNNGLSTSIMLDDYYKTGISKHWSTIRALYEEKWTGLGSKFPLGARVKRPSTDVYGKVPRNILGADNALTLRELKERWQLNVARLNARADVAAQYVVGAQRAGQRGKGIFQYGPKAKQHPESFPEPGGQFFERWSAVRARNLCLDPANGRNVCRPEDPPPGSALSRIRNSLRNLGKLARNARGVAAAFKRVGKAKGFRGKLSALGDLNKSFKTLGGGDRRGSGPAKRADGTTLGGGMPKAKSPGKTTTGISGAISVVDDAKKAARAITGKSRAKGGF